MNERASERGKKKLNPKWNYHGGNGATISPPRHSIAKRTKKKKERKEPREKKTLCAPWLMNYSSKSGRGCREWVSEWVMNEIIDRWNKVRWRWWYDECAPHNGHHTFNSLRAFHPPSALYDGTHKVQVKSSKSAAVATPPTTTTIIPW